MSVRTSDLLALLAISCALSCAAADSEVYSYLWNHPRLVEVQLMDDTDRHDELYFEKEYLLSRCEKPFDVSAPALFIEDSLTGEGIAFFRKAPLPHARTSNSPDWHVDPLGRKVTVLSNDYQGVSIRYRGGKAGRIRAATDFQRRFRPYVAGRDGLFLSNTWGDGNRDACINERFLLAEVASGAELGVDVIQIDDGWQKGRSANSASLAAGEKGRWGSWWEVEGFWDVDPVRFPNGLGKVIGEARSKGMKFGLWFGPDSSNDAANWNKDADFLLSLHRDLGVDYFKFDSMHTPTPLALSRQAMLMDRLMDESDGRITIDLDVTAGRRPGYFAFPRIGPVFVENRYIRENDVRLWWPHRTLRNLWGLAHVVDPVRLRMEVLNPERKSGLYPKGDPLAPICWPRDAIFAISMYSSPLGWFEIQNLSQETTAAWKPLIAQWKRERDAIHDGYIYPVGSAPDGLAWTGFVSAAKDGSAGTALLFRELDASEEFSLPLSDYLNVEGLEPIVIGGRGEARIEDGILKVAVHEKLGFVWVKIKKMEDASADRSSAESLVATWCDALLARQISGTGDKMIDGGIACPACGVMHGRVCDLVYPLVYRWSTTGDGKYLAAAEKAVEWSEATMLREDGGLYNDYQTLWWGTTVFAQIAIGKTLLYYDDRLPRDLHSRWSEIFRRETDFVVERFDEKFVNTTNVNYPAAFCEAMALAGVVMKDDDKTARAKAMAKKLMAQFLPDGLVTGEGAPMSKRSPRGHAYVDLGYNLEETLPSLLAYAEMCGDEKMKDAVLASAARHAEFILPDGGIDDSFGSRSPKWTYYGSRTSDGMLSVLVALAKAGVPWAGRAMERHLELFRRCTNSAGLLAGGVQYEAADEPACVHHSFSHIKSLVDVLRGGSIPRKGADARLPRETCYGLKSFPSIGVELAAVGPWRATFAGGDSFVQGMVGHRVSGGGPSLLWHEAVGPLIVGTMADYSIIEARNLQDLRHERTVLSMMPRIEAGDMSSSARDVDVEMKATCVSNAVVCSARGQLTGKRGSRGAAYELVSRVDEKVFSLCGKCGVDARFILPVVALNTDRVEIGNGRVRIEKGSSVVMIESELPFELAKTDRGDRAFSPIGGFLCAYLTAPIRAGDAFGVRLSVESK